MVLNYKPKKHRKSFFAPGVKPRSKLMTSGFLYLVINILPFCLISIDHNYLQLLNLLFKVKLPDLFCLTLPKFKLQQGIVRFYRVPTSDRTLLQLASFIFISCVFISYKSWRHAEIVLSTLNLTGKWSSLCEETNILVYTTSNNNKL